MEVEDHLISQACRDPDAFRELYRTYFARVYGYVAGRIAQREDAEDVTAEIFIKVADRLPQFHYRGAGSFAAWLFRIAYHAVSDFYRRRPPTSLPLAEDIPTAESAPENRLLAGEQAAVLQAAIRRLPPRRQEVITLKYFGGLRNQEIATILAIEERSVAAYLSRALDDLKIVIGVLQHE